MRILYGTLTIWAVVLLAAPAAGADAQEYIWRNVRVGGGGFIPNIIFSPIEPGLAYARSDMGGAYRWDAAAARWIPLQDGMAQSSYFGVESIALDPADPGRVYLAVGMYRRDEAAILRSDDRGATWEIFPVGFRMGGNEDGRGLGERLAVDPNDPARLYFGSRHNGLMRSTDAGENWTVVESFPVREEDRPQGRRSANAGISFVVFDPASGSPGNGSRTIFAGLADAGERHLYRSGDAGATWTPVPGEPAAKLLPAQAELDANGVLYIAYSVGVGPNGVTGGAVYKHDTRSGDWTDITPPSGHASGDGGYMGLSLDRQRPGTLVVATMNRWGQGDTIWRSTDGGASWSDLRPQSRHDVFSTPFLKWGNSEARFGWWISGLAIDPFDSSHVAYTTGATIYATRDLGGGTMIWRPWVEGIEQTAIIALASPPEGPFHLLSGFGDISGFAHENLAVSPSLQFTTPVFGNTNTIEFAGLAPHVAVRSGTPLNLRGGRGDAPTLAWSENYGRSWQPLKLLAQDGSGGGSLGDAAITVSADGDTFVVMTPIPRVTRDRGQSWVEASGLPAGSRPVADRALGDRFYAMDFEARRVLVSDDGALTFAALKTAGLPPGIEWDRPRSREAQWPLLATPGVGGDLWFVSRRGLYRSTDGGRSFGVVDGGIAVRQLAFGAPAPGGDYPTLFAIGMRGNTRAIWRSDDAGGSWMRVNGEAHEYGRRFRAIAGDPRVYGRVYVGTDGRGIVYGELARESESR